jgi:hypothetical protein
MNLLQALLANESGGRNIPNVHQGTSSGQAQGYFQITTGTWNDFGGTKYAPTPLQATYAQQAEIAGKIPLKRWDESTVAKMRATGKPIDPNKTLAENLAANGEGFGSDPGGAPRTSGPVEAASGGFGNEAAKDVPQLTTPPPPAVATAEPTPAEVTGDALGDIAAASYNPFGSLGATLASAVGKDRNQLQSSPMSAPLQAAPVARNIEVPLPPVAPDASPPMDLASLFKVAAVGKIPQVDSVTGRPVMRRQYG